MSATQLRTNWAEALVPGLNSWIHDEFAMFSPLHSRIFQDQPSSRQFEEEQVSAGISELLATAEDNPAPDRVKVKAKATRYTHTTYRGKMSVSKEAYDDDLKNRRGRNSAICWNISLSHRY